MEIMIGILVGLLALGGFLFYQLKMKGTAKEEGEENERFVPTTQDHLAIDYIRSGIVKLKTGGYRILVELPSVNIELMEGEEKEVILQQYRQILNAIDFPFQYFQQSRIVDVSEYISKLDALTLREKNVLIQKQLEFYKDFLQSMIQTRSVLTKKFYVSIPFDPEEEEKKKKQKYQEILSEKDKKNLKKKIEAESEEEDVYKEEKRFEKARKQLYSRGVMIERSFRRFDINPKVLNDEELLELFYTAYNKDRSVNQSMKNNSISDYTTMRVKTAERRGKK